MSATMVTAIGVSMAGAATGMTAKPAEAGVD